MKFLIAGVDEVGRGSLIGPVVTCAFIIDNSFNIYVKDSKVLSEKKRNEILQMLTLEPSLSILDETDSGLDIDALKIISDGVNRYKSPKHSFLIITHYQRLLEYIEPDIVFSALVIAVVAKLIVASSLSKPTKVTVPPEQQ